MDAETGHCARDAPHHGPDQECGEYRGNKADLQHLSPHEVGERPGGHERAEHLADAAARSVQRDHESALVGKSARQRAHCGRMVH